MAGNTVAVFGALPGRQKAVRGAFVGPSEYGRGSGFIGPRNQTIGAQAGKLVVDLGPALKKIEHVLNEAAELIGKRGVNSAMYRAINYATGGAYARISRDLVNQTGAPLNRIRAVVREDRAHPNRLEWRLKSSDQPMKMIDFAPRAKPGQKNPTVTPWNRSQKLRGTFVIGPKGGAATAILKATNHPHKHPKGGLLNARTVWGPIIPREMLRKNSQTYQELFDLVPKVLEPRLLHELEHAIAMAINSAK